MKMTMHIDEELLARVMADYDFETKTEAVEAGLKELDRRKRLAEFREHGLGLTPEELSEGVDPAYMPEVTGITLVAEERPPSPKDDGANPTG